MDRLYKFLSLLICLSPTTSLGNESELLGQSEKFQIRITAYDFQEVSVIEKATIEVTKLDHEGLSYSRKVISVPFASECVMDKTLSMFSCSKSGKSIFAGVIYKRTSDATPECPGSQTEHRYTCWKGCSKYVPRYLNIRHYEC